MDDVCSGACLFTGKLSGFPSFVNVFNALCSLPQIRLPSYSAIFKIWLWKVHYSSEHISNALVGTRKTPPRQVAGPLKVYMRSCANWWQDKHYHQRKLQRSRLSWALVGAGCSNQLQVAQGQGLVRVCALVKMACVCDVCRVCVCDLHVASVLLLELPACLITLAQKLSQCLGHNSCITCIMCPSTCRRALFFNDTIPCYCNVEFGGMWMWGGVDEVGMQEMHFLHVCTFASTHVWPCKV